MIDWPWCRGSVEGHRGDVMAKSNWHKSKIVHPMARKQKRMRKEAWVPKSL